MTLVPGICPIPDLGKRPGLGQFFWRFWSQDWDGGLKLIASAITRWDTSVYAQNEFLYPLICRDWSPMKFTFFALVSGIHPIPDLGKRPGLGQFFWRFWSQDWDGGLKLIASAITRWDTSVYAQNEFLYPLICRDWSPLISGFPPPIPPITPVWAAAGWPLGKLHWFSQLSIGGAASLAPVHARCSTVRSCLKSRGSRTVRILT